MASTITILGSPNNDDGSLSQIAISRATYAIELANTLTNDSIRYILTGGFGEHFNRTARPHVDYLETFLNSLGVSSSSIEAKLLSRNTNEDIEMLSKYLNANPRLVNSQNYIVTSDYHVERVEHLLKRDALLNSCRVKFIGAQTVLANEELELLRAHEMKALAQLRVKN